jgi:SAM-dependent methyltransferase
MTSQPLAIPSLVSDRLRCPDCVQQLHEESGELVCSKCERRYSYPCLIGDGKRVHMEFQSAWSVEEVMRDVKLGWPKVTYKGTPPRGATDIASLLNDLKPCQDAVVLDLGCGPGDFKSVADELGYQWVGVDISQDSQRIQADVHAIPFMDSSFDCCYSISVMEHVHNPFVVASEVWRVLKPGAPFFGVGSFGEPFHSSFFHMSPWGFASCLCKMGFRLERLWKTRDTLGALGSMGGYPRIVRPFIRGIGRVAQIPALSPRRWLSGDENDVETLTTAGSIGFLAYKEERRTEDSAS